MTAPTRRQTLATLVSGAVTGAAGGLVAGPAAGAGASMRLEGRQTYSESVQVACGDPAGNRFVVLRLCQYPEMGVAWLWAAAVIDGRFALMVDNEAPWSGTSSVQDGAQAASYAAVTRAASFSFSRSGPRDRPSAATARFEGSHRRRRFAVSALFEPAAGFTGLLQGRSEQFGAVRAEVTIGGQSYVIEGPGQWHEQPQTDPRFVHPFVYASLWGPGIFSTLLQTEEGSGGYVIAPTGVTRFDRATFAAPGRTRRVRASGPDGSMDLMLHEVRSYGFGVYRQTWRGAFVRTRLGDTPMIGFANTFPTGYRPA